MSIDVWVSVGVGHEVNTTIYWYPVSILVFRTITLHSHSLKLDLAVSLSRVNKIKQKGCVSPFGWSTEDPCVVPHALFPVIVPCEIPCGGASLSLGLRVKITRIRALHSWVRNVSKKETCIVFDDWHLGDICYRNITFHPDWYRQQEEPLSFSVSFFTHLKNSLLIIEATDSPNQIWYDHVAETAFSNTKKIPKKSA